MARIKVNDIPKDQKISKEELKRIRGGADIKHYSTVFFPKVGSVSPYLKFDGEKW